MLLGPMLWFKRLTYDAEMLSVTGGTKIFYRGTQDERRALDGLDIALKPADFCIVIGSNGAGIEFSQRGFRQAAAGSAAFPSMARMSQNLMPIAGRNSLPGCFRTR